MKYRKKPIVVDAIQYKGTYEWKVITPCKPDIWANDAIIESLVHDSTENNPTGEFLRVFTSKGMMIAIVNDWIIRGVNGEFYCCKPDIFEKIYEPVEEM